MTMIRLTPSRIAEPTSKEQRASGFPGKHFVSPALVIRKGGRYPVEQRKKTCVEDISTFMCDDIIETDIATGPQ